MTSNVLCAAAINAAGIVDAMRAGEQRSDACSDRLQELSELYQGWIGVLTQVAEAGALMEAHRERQGRSAMWGGELPCVYDVWDAIAKALCNRLGHDSLEQIVHNAIELAKAADVR